MKKKYSMQVKNTFVKYDTFKITYLANNGGFFA